MKYPLLPYSQLVFDLTKTNSNVYVFESVIRLRKEKVDIPRLKRAIEEAIRNHPVFQMHVDEDGLQQLAPLEDILHGQYHAVDFIDGDGYVDVQITGNRILGDGRSGVLISEDVARAYNGQPLLPDNYLGYLKSVEELKQSPRYAADRRWLEAQYGNISCPVHPQTDIPIAGNEIPVEGTLWVDYSDLQNSLYAAGEKHLLSLNGLFSLASAMAIMDYNDTDAAALTWAYEGRERPEEQRVFGSLHRDIPFQINHKSQIINQKSDLIRQARDQFRLGIAHSSYPFTLTASHSDIWNYAVNVLVQPTKQENTMALPFAFEDITPDSEQHLAYSLLDVEIYEGEKLFINYRYSATHYKQSSIRRFAELVKKNIIWLLSD